MPVFCRYVAPGNVADIRPGADRTAGQVQVVGTRVTIISKDITALNPLGTTSLEGIWDVPKVDAQVITAGDLVYWNPTGDPVGGTPTTGAATTESAGASLMGVAVPLQLNNTNATALGDAFVRVQLSGLSVNLATVGGAVTAVTSINAPVLVAAGVGGAIPIAGGAGHTDNNGGAVSLTGGAGAGTGAGGQSSLVGGAAGATGTGGAIAVTGGSAAGGIGGAIAVTGGAGGGANAGGASSVVGGAGGATGAGGAVALTGGAGGTTSGTGGAVTITSGAGTLGDAQSGAVAIDAGAPHGTGTGGAITIGGTNASSITFGKMPRIPTATVVADGADNTNATAVAEGFTLVTASNGAKGVILPSAVAGMQVIIKEGEGAVLKVYPGASDTINGLTHTTDSLDIAANTTVMLVAYDATAWYSLPLLPS